MKKVSIDSPAVAHGLGLFETMLVVNRRPIHVAEHYERMVASCASLGFPAPDAALFRHEIDAVLLAAPSGEAALRCLWVAGADASRTSSWELAAGVSLIPPVTLARRERGRAVVLDASVVRSLPHHKMTSYAVCAIALRRAVEAGADEALFVSRDGHVLEGTSTNVFAVRGATLVTAPIPTGVLPGIVRSWVLAAAARLGLAVEERAPSVEELLQGAFLTSSLTTLTPLRSIDGLSCAAPGDVFDRLRELWNEEIERA